MFDTAITAVTVQPMQHNEFSGTKINIDYFIQEVVDPDEEEEIYEYFKEADDDNIKKAMEELGEDYYDEMHVRLVRLKFHCDLGN